MPEKPPLNREELRDVIDLSLWAGQLLLHNGAESERVEETVHKLGTGLGCDWMDILVSPNAILVTTISGDEFRTKVRRVVGYAVDMDILAVINDMSYQVSAGTLDRFQVRQMLADIDDRSRQVNHWIVIVMVGLACAAFSRLFGGDWPVFGITFVAASVAMFVRRELARRYFNPLLIVIVTAFVAGLIASSATLLDVSDAPELALVSSVLLLLPGVPLINSAEDLIKGHLVTGIVRGVLGGLISLAIALGLLLAMRLVGVSGL